MAAKMKYSTKNTVMVRFGDQVRSSSDGEMVTFVVRSLGIKPDQVSHLYYDPFEKCIVIKFANETLMKMCLEQHIGEKVFGYSSGQVARVMVMDGNEEIKYVRLFYLPPEVPDKEIAEFLKKFGAVKKIVHEKRSLGSGFNCFSGVRGIYMDVNKEIPPQIYMCNYRCRVYYSGMQERCFVCKATDHLKPDCPRRSGTETNKTLTPRGRVQEREESMALNFTNLNSLVRGTENREGGVDNNAASGQRGGDSDTMNVDGEDRDQENTGNTGADAAGVSAVTANGGGWVNVHTKANRSGTSGLSKGSSGDASLSHQQGEKPADSTAEVTVRNGFAGLLEAADNEKSDADPKKRKMSSLNSLKNE